MSSSAPKNPLITAEIDSGFNAILLEAFLCGLYTLLFAYTLRTLWREKNKQAYAMLLTLLWVLVMVSFAFDWQYHRTAFVIANDSPLHIAIVVAQGTGVKSLGILDNMFTLSCNWVADALLIWRCYILWEDTRWILLPLPILLIATIVLGSLFSAFNFGSAVANDDFKFLLSSFSLSIAITFMGTSLIILRILLVTRSSHLTTHTSAYRKIWRIIVESGILYTIAMFIAGITLGIQVTSNKPTTIPLGVLATYAEAVLVPLSGIGPTLIAARVASEPSRRADIRPAQNHSTSSALSHFTFKRTIQPNSTFDVEAIVSCQDDSPTKSSM